VIPIFTDFEDFAGKFRKISKNHKKSKILKNSIWSWTGRIWLSERSNKVVHWNRSQLRTWADPESKNPNLMPNDNKNNNKRKINTGK